MSELSQGRGFSWRALTSMLTTGGFLVMAITGLMLFITPEGRLAYWVDWSVLGLSKSQWGDIHVTSSLIFILFGFIHLWYNWRQFVSYLRRRLEAGVRVRSEGPIALALMAVLVVGTLYSVPPFTYVLDLSATIKDSWKTDPSMEPPFGHAEEVSLKTLALRTASNTADIVAAIRAGGYKVDSADQTVKDVATLNHVSPSDLWTEVVKRVPTAAPEPIDAKTKVWTAEEVETAFEGRGFGNKTVEQTAAEVGLATDEVLARLKAGGVEATAGDRLRPLADAIGSTPTELLKVVLVSGYKISGK